ncbi:MAG TPA: type IV secretory system conjugative DNA transfer family protein [Clostridia bacterium]|nr:type IV secretory system conjugative DNA transfer family protein [Clostridia bacterium]
MGKSSIGRNIAIFLVVTLIYLSFSVYFLMPLVHLYGTYSLKNQTQLETLNASMALYKDPWKCYQMLGDPVMLKGWFLGAIALGAILILLGYVIKENNLDSDGVNYLKDDGTHGTANWMTEKEATKVLEIGTEKGVLLGLHNDKDMVTLPSKTFFNKNIAVFGSSGSMKSRAFVRPNIMQLVALEQSMIITDPKGEMYHSMAEYLRDNGYIVKAFNLVNMAKSDRWNPLREIRDDIDAQTFVEVIIANTNTGPSGGDQFWERAEQNLLKALVLYVIDQYPIEEISLETVYALLSAEDAAAIDKLFEKLPRGHPAKAPYNIYAQASETVRTGVVIGLGTRLNVFQNVLVQKLTNGNDMDLSLPGKEKCAYFCISSDMDTTFDFLAGLFFSFMFINLIRYADSRGGTGEKEVFFILDEFPNIGAIPDFTKKISTMRSRGVHSWVIFQNIAQLKNRYPHDGWQEILGNCDTRLFLGCTDYMTAEFVCNLLGQSTVQAVSKMKKAGLEGAFDFGRVSKSTQRRNLLNPDEILRMEAFTGMVILRGQKPLLVNKMDYTRHKDAKLLRDKAISEYEQEWSKGIKINDMFSKFNEIKAELEDVNETPSTDELLDKDNKDTKRKGRGLFRKVKEHRERKQVEQQLIAEEQEKVDSFEVDEPVADEEIRVEPEIVVPEDPENVVVKTEIVKLPDWEILPDDEDTSIDAKEQELEDKTPLEPKETIAINFETKASKTVQIPTGDEDKRARGKPIARANKPDKDKPDGGRKKSLGSNSDRSARPPNYKNKTASLSSHEEDVLSKLFDKM